MGQDTSTARRNMALLDTSAVRRSMTLDTSPGRSAQHMPPSSPSRLTVQLAPGLHQKTSEKDFLRLAPTAEGSGSEGGNGAAAVGRQRDGISGGGGHGGMAVGQNREGSFSGGGVPRTFSLLSLPQQYLEAEPGSAFPLSVGPDASVRPPSFNLNRGASSLMLSALIGGGGGGGSYAQLADAALGGSGTPPVVPAGGAARPQSLRSAAATAATWRPEALLKLLATPSDPVRNRIRCSTMGEHLAAYNSSFTHLNRHTFSICMYACPLLHIVVECQLPICCSSLRACWTWPTTGSSIPSSWRRPVVGAPCHASPSS